MGFGAIVPNMPDVILRRIFDFLTYKELCRLECICKRWRKLIWWIFKRDILELTVEQSITYTTVSVNQQVPFKRLSVCCSFDAVDFLSGILRRSRLYVRKLSCDLRFLAYLDRLQCDRETNRRYWSNVDELWLVIAKLDDHITQKFLSIESSLFLSLQEMTVQIHEGSTQVDSIDRVISSIVQRFPNIDINMELHASNSDEIYAQLNAFSKMELKKLKLICVSYEPARISLTLIAHLLKQRNITVHNFTLRDWCIVCEPNEALFHNKLNTFRISSCNIENVDSLSSALLKTVMLAENDSSLGGINVLNNSTENGKKLDETNTIESAQCFIERLEVAGQCFFHGLDYLNEKAHVEFEHRILSKIPLLEIDCSEIYYCV